MVKYETFFVVLFVLIVITVEGTELTFVENYCIFGGDCTLNDLHLTGNLSFIGSVINITVLNQNITGQMTIGGSLNVNGNVTADNFFGNSAGNGSGLTDLNHTLQDAYDDQSSPLLDAHIEASDGLWFSFLESASTFFVDLADTNTFTQFLVSYGGVEGFDNEGFKIANHICVPADLPGCVDDHILIVRSNKWLPFEDNTYDLGGRDHQNNLLRWRDLYLAGKIEGSKITYSDLSGELNLSGVLRAGEVVSGNWTPSINNTYDIGSNELRWKDAYFSGVIHGDNINITGVTGEVFSGSWLPFADDIYDLGRAGGTQPPARWRNLHYSGALIGPSGSPHSVLVNASTGEARFGHDNFNITNNGTVVTSKDVFIGNNLTVDNFANVKGNLSVGNINANLSLEFGFNGSIFLFTFGNPNILFNYTRNVSFINDVTIDGTLYGGSPVKIAGINISENVFSLTDKLNQSLKFTLHNLDNGSNATTVIRASNDMGGTMAIGVGSSRFEIGTMDYANATALFSRSRGVMLFANFFNERFDWLINPQDDDDPNNLVEVMRLDENSLNISTNLIATGNVSMDRVTSEVIFETKIDIGVPGSGGGLDIGEGGSYTTNKTGDTIVQAFTYDASAASGSRFTELTLDSSNTLLADAGDRLYIGSTHLFWAARFEISTAMGDSHIQMRYYDKTISNLSNMTHMGILKDSAITEGEHIWNQTAEKEYVTWDHEVEINWNKTDNIADLIPDGNEDMFWVVFEVPTAGITNAPVIEEIKVRGTDTDFVTGLSHMVLWGDARIGIHERIPLTIAKTQGGTGTTNLDIDSAHQQTVFNFNGAGDEISWLWVLPECIDTSSKIDIKLDVAASAADTFDFTFTAKELRNGTVIGAGISPEFQSSISVVIPAANTIYVEETLTPNKISIENMTASDIISFELERTDGANAIYPMSITIHHLKWCIGNLATLE